jgi:arsenite/tail-anchored protein-transporting ATPase
VDSIDPVQLTLFSGKGGVGKTTLACGLARRWAQQWPQQQGLLLSTDPAHSLGDVLGIDVDNRPQLLPDLPNLQVRSLDAAALLIDFRHHYGPVLELLVERGSFVDGGDLSPIWDLGWPGLDELMALLEIERLLRPLVPGQGLDQGSERGLAQAPDRIFVDMAPSGHTLNLFGLMDFLDTLLQALSQFQAKHRYLAQALAGRCSDDSADRFLQQMQHDLSQGRQLLQDPARTACWIVAIAEPMSLLESQRFAQALKKLQIPLGGCLLNRLALPGLVPSPLVEPFSAIAPGQPLWGLPLQQHEPIGGPALDRLMAQLQPLETGSQAADPTACQWPAQLAPPLPDYVAVGRRLLLIGGKGGVGKTTVAAAVAWGLALQHPEAAVRVVSIDPAHSLGDALGCRLGHQPMALTANLTAQEIDAHTVLEDFRHAYLWELAEMMAGDTDEAGLQLAYGPQAWRQIVAQALPGIDEMLSLITVMELLEDNTQQLIVLDTAPTGHLLRFLEMPAALSDWLGWIFKLWIKHKAVAGRVELMGRLRTLRQRVIRAQAKLTDPQHTEFIGVVRNQSAILAEAQRLSQRLAQLGIAQPYLIHNCCQPPDSLAWQGAGQTVVRLPQLPAAAPEAQIKGAAALLF